jgi:hypothetical protein
MWLFLLIHSALLGLPAEIWLARYVARKRRAGLPIFDYRSAGSPSRPHAFPEMAERPRGAHACRSRRCDLGDPILEPRRTSGGMTGMSDEPKKPSWAWIGWTVAALPLLYVLSSGPMIWLCRHNYLSFEFWMWAAEPLSWTYDRSVIARRFLDWYSTFWTSP